MTPQRSIAARSERHGKVTGVLEKSLQTQESFLFSTTGSEEEIRKRAKKTLKNKRGVGIRKTKSWHRRQMRYSTENDESIAAKARQVTRKTLETLQSSRRLLEESHRVRSETRLIISRWKRTQQSRQFIITTLD
jgi:hypothetical protein